MKFFAKFNIFKKIIIAFMIIASFSVVEPKKVNAVGGELMSPICDLLVGLGDGVINVIHKTLIKQDETLIRISNINNEWKNMWVAVGAILVGAIAGAIIVAVTGGIAAIVAATIGINIAAIGAGTVMMCSLAAGAAAGVAIYRLDMWGDEIVFPLYSVTPETIFTAEVPLFDVNFINPKKEVVKANRTKEYSIVNNGKKDIGNHITDKDFKDQTGITKSEFIKSAESTSSTSVSNSGTSRSFKWRRRNKYIYKRRL